VKVQDKITDMEFIELRKFTRQMVYTVYQVNPDVLWITENSNRSVWETQSMDYWNTISSKEQIYEEFLTQIIQKIYWDEYIVEILQDSLRVLQQKTQIAWDLYKNQRVITLNEAREIIQYPKIESWGDKFFSWEKILKEVTEK
jgi:phage portal protein BeeE